MQKRKPPVRMCIGCGAHKDKRELIRVVRNKEGEIRLDPTGKMAGRGAYLCCDVSCLQKCRKTRKLERGFSCQIPDEVYDGLEAQLLSEKEAASVAAK